MGLLSFWKKKDSDLPAVQSLDAQTLPADLPSDLPSIDGMSIPELDVQPNDAMQMPNPSADSMKTDAATPQQRPDQRPDKRPDQRPDKRPDMSQAIQTGMSLDSSKSISFNVPTLDFSLPPADDVTSNPSDNPLGMGAQSLQELPSLDSTIPSLDSLQNTPAQSSNLQSQLQGQLQQPNAVLGDKNTSADVEDNLNRLFINDSDWKEPDWNNFEPYSEDKIDEPTVDDFKGADLPKFEDAAPMLAGIANAANKSSTGGFNMANTADISISEPTDPFRKTSQSDNRPLELFIRGKAYNKVFIELDLMNKALIHMDAEANGYEELLKKEEPVLSSAKEQMEYLYRKTNQIDKKIFAQ